MKVGGRSWRIGVMGNTRLTMILEINLENFNSEMQQVRNAFFIVLPVALLLIAAGGWLLAQRALRPVTALTQTAEQITVRGLDQRIPVEDKDKEFMRLITVFNRMMDRLEKSFGQAVRFSADAAHELKTPLTILQGQLEQAVQGAQAGSEEQRTYSELLEEVQRLKAITRKLLLLSRADSGQLSLSMELLDLSELLEDICEDTRILAPHLTVGKDIAPDLRVKADSDLICQVPRNLTDNAIKFNWEGTQSSSACAGGGRR